MDAVAQPQEPASAEVAPAESGAPAPAASATSAARVEGGAEAPEGAATREPERRAAYTYGATDFGPRQPREIELCRKAAHTDWLYLGGSVMLTGAAIWSDGRLKGEPKPGIRLIGPSAVGLTWGVLVGGFRLALPQCDERWVPSAPPEGNVRSSWPMALSFAALAAITAPVVVGIETGAVPTEWAVRERSGRLVLAGAAGFVGALIPYALPPRTWRAREELERIRAGVTTGGAFVSYAVAF